MIKTWVKTCIIQSGIDVADVVSYCDVTEEDIQKILNDGDYSVNVAEKILDRLGVFCKKGNLPIDRMSIPHIELETGIILFRKDSDSRCRFLTVSSNATSKVERLSANCYGIDMKSPY